MRIAFCHNYYQQSGGEDQVFHAESSMMEEQGHDVLRYTRHNDEINDLSKFTLMKKTFWNKEVYGELANTFKDFKPDVVHFTNTFPIISPAAYKAAHGVGAAVIQSLHNFRLICPGSLLLRNGRNCESCVGKTFAWPAIWNSCYRNNFFATAVTAGANSWHRLRGTYQKYVNRFIALTDFSRQKFVEGGLDPDRIVVKQNFSSTTSSARAESRNGRALFVGRLSPEKGIDVLLDCWNQIESHIGLDIVGEGPMQSQLESATRSMANVQLLGKLENDEVKELMERATVQIVPSNAYETFGIVVVEAFGAGTPVIASDHGSLAELIEHEKTGLKFEPGNAIDLKAQVMRLMCDAELRSSISENACTEFKNKYTKEANYRLLQQIYQDAVEEVNQ